MLLQDDKPVYHASQALTGAELRYATTEAEILAVFFAYCRFHQYISIVEVLLWRQTAEPAQGISELSAGLGSQGRQGPPKSNEKNVIYYLYFFPV